MKKLASVADTLSCTHDGITTDKFSLCIRVSRKWNTAARLRSAWPSGEFDYSHIGKEIYRSWSVMKHHRKFSIVPMQMPYQGQCNSRLSEDELITRMYGLVKENSPWRFLPILQYAAPSNKPISDRVLVAIADCFPNLSALSLRVTISNHVLLSQFFARIGTGLRVLQLTQTKTSIEAYFPLMPNLRVLSVDKVKVPDRLLYLTQLETLQLLSFDEVPLMGNSRQERELHYARLMRNIRVLSVHHNLRSLTLVVGIPTEFLRSLVAPDLEDPSLPPSSLTHLDISSTWQPHEPEMRIDFLLAGLPKVVSLRTDRCLDQIHRGGERPNGDHLAAVLKSLSQLTSLTVAVEERSLVPIERNHPDEDPNLRVLDHTRNLTKLTITSRYFQLEDVYCLLVLSHMPNLREFIWKNLSESTALAPEFYARFRELKQLEVLKLPLPLSNLMSAGGLAVISELPKLRRLILSHASYTGSLPVDAIRIIARSDSLRTIELSTCLPYDPRDANLANSATSRLIGLFRYLSGTTKTSAPTIHVERLLRLRLIRNDSQFYRLVPDGEDSAQ